MQNRFVAELLTDPARNLTQAALRAGCKPTSAPQQGCKWAKLAKVAAILATREQELAAKLSLDAEWVLRRLKMLADFDVRKFYDADGNLKKPSELDDDTAFALQGMEVEKLFAHFGKGAAKEVGTTTKVKYADKGINLERIGRHLKMFTDKVEVSGMDVVADELSKARNRRSGRNNAKCPK
jgi:phage terminase small subunit